MGIRIKISDIDLMKRDVFLRNLKRYCKAHGLAFDFDPRHGKGGHGRVTVDGRFTTVQTELKPLHIQTILKQLGLPKDAV